MTRMETAQIGRKEGNRVHNAANPVAQNGHPAIGLGSPSPAVSDPRLYSLSRSAKLGLPGDSSSAAFKPFRLLTRSY